ncbi:RagB/SusD family nutrient uptake outer membrane protein [Sphingobacterium corticibacter]|uniref:RagB/SusD family nutrient uptake outer membrane protein n=1 Tax=Sphingobacterium corticibacter TaxID=2171749 RepID=A0A2T8HEL0_9SPHI|nr:RagB/SusD family nutrient uptake outer membrane protein [Sphingobacterium corticibacter]PVH23867.1 RagB/SusD family nutrient uptake outer membrane protein [Sphingobacterium corticibacter]
MKRIVYITAIAWSTLLFSGCEKMLEVNPRQSIDAADALTSQESITAATNAVYARLREVSLYGRDLIAIPDVLADNTINTLAGNRLVREWNNQIGSHLSNWQQSYYGINQINLILAALDEFDTDQAYKDGIRGQNLFLRALYYHNLMRAYAYDPTAIVAAQNRGGVPIMQRGAIAVEEIEFSSRASIEETYAYIYRDLQEAYELIPASNNSRGPFFATKGAVAALFSRVALYNGDYERVLTESEKAMNSGVATFPNATQLEASWRSERHPESFFEIPFATPDNIGSNESLRATYMTRTTVGSTATASHGNVVISEDLLAQFSATDARRAFIQSGLGNNRAYFEINKFASKNGVPNLDNVPVIRYAEVVLNRAEALAALNQTALANTELNKIRTRANLTAVSLQGEALKAEILQQRRLEFAFEGHRFFDLKRLGLPIVKESETIAFEDLRILSRIPVREVEINSNLEQNFGY